MGDLCASLAKKWEHHPGNVGPELRNRRKTTFLWL